MYTYREICRVAGTNRYSLYRTGYTVGPANHSHIHHAATMPAKQNLIFIESTYDSVNSSPAPWTRAPHIKDLPRAPGCTSNNSSRNSCTSKVREWKRRKNPRVVSSYGEIENTVNVRRDVRRGKLGFQISFPFSDIKCIKESVGMVFDWKLLASRNLCLHPRFVLVSNIIKEE